jgi:hypothetical protein
MKVTWEFSLTPAESRLVLKALGGRLVTAEDKLAARELGDRLTVDRGRLTQQLAGEMRKHVTAMQSEGE